ncbi:MAG: hypothetical protein KDA38_08515, partial [Planctomycetales bacterium]|nr:hypothetical protein [Planctomycetales bacterium]
ARQSSQPRMADSSGYISLWPDDVRHGSSTRGSARYARKAKNAAGRRAEMPESATASQRDRRRGLIIRAARPYHQHISIVNQRNAL